jgi:hypothetical protein
MVFGNTQAYYHNKRPDIQGTNQGSVDSKDPGEFGIFRMVR